MSKISIVTPTFNEEENIQKLCDEIKSEMEKLNLDYEHIIIDNASKDNTVKILKQICKDNEKIKAGKIYTYLKKNKKFVLINVLNKKKTKKLKGIIHIHSLLQYGIK